MLDTALRPRPFPAEAGSLLPGLLAATRTGPTPAGDDGLVVESRGWNHRPPTVWAHSASSCNLDRDTTADGQTVTGWATFLFGDGRACGSERVSLDGDHERG